MTQRQASWGVFTLLSGNLLIDSIEVSSFFTLMPRMTQELGLETAHLLLLVAAFPIGFAVAIPLAGPISSLLGIRNTFTIALALFSCACFLPLIGTPLLLIEFGRLVKGLSAGLTTPLGITLITQSFNDAYARKQAMKLYSLVGGWGFLVGLLITGPIVDVSWRFALMWTGPIALVLVVASLFLLPRKIEASSSDLNFIFPLVLLIVVLTIPITTQLWWPLSVSLSVLTVSCSIAISLNYSLTQLSDLSKRSLLINATTAALFNGGFLVFLLIGQFYIQREVSSIFTATLLLSPVVLGLALASTITQYLVDRIPLQRLILCGVIAQVVAFTAVTLLSSSIPLVVFASGLLGIAFLLGFLPLNFRALEGVPRESRSSAMVTYQTFVQGGAVVCILSLLAAPNVQMGSPLNDAGPTVVLGTIGLALLILGSFGLRSSVDRSHQS